MLRSNCSAVKNKIRAYIIENYNGEGFEPGSPEAEARTYTERSIFCHFVRRFARGGMAPEPLRIY